MPMYHHSEGGRKKGGTRENKESNDACRRKRMESGENENVVEKKADVDFFLSLPSERSQPQTDSIDGFLLYIPSYSLPLSFLLPLQFVS